MKYFCPGRRPACSGTPGGGEGGGELRPQQEEQDQLRLQRDPAGHDEEPHPVSGGQRQPGRPDLQTPAGPNQEELSGLLRVSGKSVSQSA